MNVCVCMSSECLLSSAALHPNESKSFTKLHTAGLKIGGFQKESGLLVMVAEQEQVASDVGG